MSALQYLQSYFIADGEFMIKKQKTRGDKMKTVKGGTLEFMGNVSPATLHK